MSTRRRVTPALTSEQERGFLRWAYLERYDADPDFGQALVALYDRWTADIGELPFNWWELSSRAVYGEAALAAGHAPPAGHEAIARYVDEVEELARRFGLDQITGDGASSRPSLGVGLIHEWCRFRQWQAARGREWGPEDFSTGHGFGGWEPDIGELVRRETWLVEGPDGRVAIVDEDRRPTIHVSFDDVWDPRRERLRDARRRLVRRATQAIKAELDRLAAEAEAKGYRFLDTAPNLQRDLDWLFWRVRAGLTYGQILERESELHGTERTGEQGTEESAVRHAVTALAARVGVKLTRRA